MIVIQYWPMLARASGLFRMCAEAGATWEHKTDAKAMGCVMFGAEDSKNLAPPVVIDGQVTISQGIACHVYLGNKFGLNKNIPYPELALQYMHDLDDLHNEMKGAFMKGKDDVIDLKEYLTGDRYKKHMSAIDRQIKGPFYFGDEPTYVDFIAVSYFEMCEGRWLNPLLDKSGDTIAEHAPKLRILLDKVRALESAVKLKSIPPLLPNRKLSPEQVATWGTIKRARDEHGK